MEAGYDVDEIIQKLLEFRGIDPERQVEISSKELDFLCNEAKKVFSQESPVLKLEAPINVVGDIRGDYPSMLKVFEYGGFPPDSRYLFLGSIIGRDKQPIECFCLLLAYKIKYPEHIFIIRGYYEIQGVNKMHGLYDACIEIIRKERN